MKKVEIKSKRVDRTSSGGGLASEDEDIQLVELSLPELWVALDTGELLDAKTIIAAQWLRRRQENIVT